MSWALQQNFERMIWKLEKELWRRWAGGDSEFMNLRVMEMRMGPKASESRKLQNPWIFRISCLQNTRIPKLKDPEVSCLLELWILLMKPWSSRIRRFLNSRISRIPIYFGISRILESPESHVSRISVFRISESRNSRIRKFLVFLISESYLWSHEVTETKGFWIPESL